MGKYIAVIDTETNWYDEVMSIGVVVADSVSFEPVSTKYFVLNPEAEKGGMYGYVLDYTRNNPSVRCCRDDAIQNLKQWLGFYGIDKIYAYNAKFDMTHLKELVYLDWYDIMGIAVYKQYNSKIPECAECFKTGRLKRNFGVEPIYRMLSGDDTYREIHNALTDALDELDIMRLLNHNIDVYEKTKIIAK